MIMAKQVGFGIIGIGNMGSAHAQMMKNIPNVKLVAACDIKESAFDRLPAEYRDSVICCTDIEKFWEVPGLEAVLIAVPHYFHVDLAIAAMEHGKHIIVEKPIAVHKKEAERLLAAAEKYPDLVRSTMFNQRTLPAHRKLKSLIDNGELGEINRVTWVITDWFRTQLYYDSGDWRATWAGEGGGVLLNQCPHQLDLMQWLFGLPEKVTAQAKIGKYHDIEVEDEVNAYMEFPNGATGIFVTSTAEAPGTNRLEIAGTKGRLIYENKEIKFTRNEVPSDKFLKNVKNIFGVPKSEDVQLPEINGITGARHFLLIQNFVNAILNGEKLVAPLHEAVNGLELGNAMLYSGLKDKTVTLPLDSDAYAEMLSDLVANSRYVKKKINETSGTAADLNASFS